MLGRDTKKNTKKTRFFEDKPKWVKQKKDKKTSKKLVFLCFFQKNYIFFDLKSSHIFIIFRFYKKLTMFRSPHFIFFVKNPVFSSLLQYSILKSSLPNQCSSACIHRKNKKKKKVKKKVKKK